MGTFLAGLCVLIGLFRLAHAIRYFADRFFVLGKNGLLK